MAPQSGKARLPSNNGAFNQSRERERPVSCVRRLRKSDGYGLRGAKLALYAQSTGILEDSHTHATRSGQSLDDTTPVRILCVAAGLGFIVIADTQGSPPRDGECSITNMILLRS